MKSVTLDREYLLGKKVKISSLSDFHIVAGTCCLLGLEMATWSSCSYKDERSYGVFIGRQGLFLCVSKGDWESDEDDVSDYYDLEEIGISLFKEQTPVNKTKRTKVEYVKCEIGLSEIARAMIDGDIFYDKDGLNSYAWSGYRFEVNNGRAVEIRGDFYRRTEVEIDWRKALSEFIDNNDYIEDYTSVSEAMGEPGCNANERFDNEFVKMCHLVASLTPKP